jgi:mitochondrial fission process protein 1
MSLTQCVVERSVFQAVASMAIPTLVIHTSVDITKHLTRKINRFQRWGPSIVGLSIIPLLPMYLDHPVEEALEHMFAHYGPWAKKQHKD